MNNASLIPADQTPNQSPGPQTRPSVGNPLLPSSPRGDPTRPDTISHVHRQSMRVSQGGTHPPLHRLMWVAGRHDDCHQRKPQIMRGPLVVTNEAPYRETYVLRWSSPVNKHGVGFAVITGVEILLYSCDY